MIKFPRYDYVKNTDGDFLCSEKLDMIHVEKCIETLKNWDALGRYYPFALDYDGLWFFFYDGFAVKIRYDKHPEVFADRFFHSEFNADIGSQVSEAHEAETIKVVIYTKKIYYVNESC